MPWTPADDMVFTLIGDNVSILLLALVPARVSQVQHGSSNGLGGRLDMYFGGRLLMSVPSNVGSMFMMKYFTSSAVDESSVAACGDNVWVWQEQEPPIAVCALASRLLALLFSYSQSRDLGHPAPLLQDHPCSTRGGR